MTTDQNPQVTIRSAVPAYSDQEPEEYAHQDVSASIIVDNSAEYQLTYNDRLEYYTTSDIVVDELSNYQITVDPPIESDLKSVYAETDVPAKEKLQEMEFITNKSYQLPNNGSGLFPWRHIYDVSFTMPEELQGNYYLLLPVGRIIDQDLHQRFYTDEFDTYTINAITEKPNNFDVVLGGNGLLMNYSNGESIRNLEMNISLDVNIVKTLNLHRHIYFYLQNITEDYYKYLKSSSNVDYNGTSFLEPIIEYTNIENGLGIYGGAAVTLDSLLISN